MLFNPRFAALNDDDVGESRSGRVAINGRVAVPGDRVQVAPAQRRWPKFGLPEFLRVGFTQEICQQFR